MYDAMYGNSKQRRWQTRQQRENAEVWHFEHVRCTPDMAVAVEYYLYNTADCT